MWYSKISLKSLVIICKAPFCKIPIGLIVPEIMNSWKVVEQYETKKKKSNNIPFVSLFLKINIADFKTIFGLNTSHFLTCAK